MKAPLFTADLKKGGPGSYDFGYIDDKKHIKPVTYVDVDSSKGYWGFTCNGYAVGSAKFVPDTLDSIMDTGTSLLLLPARVVKAYYSKVSGASYNETAGGWTIPCSSVPPNFTLGVGTYKAVVPGGFINYGPLLTDERSMTIISTCFRCQPEQR